MRNIDFSKVIINGGFWKIKQDMLKNTTVYSVYNRFKETHRFSALECKWKDGDEIKPHIYWDSDVAKWIEGAAYLLQYEKNDELESIIESAVDNIIKNADENGYFNSHFLVIDTDKRFTNRRAHELYCLGHFIEAAIAYKNATGKDRFLKAMCKYADYIERVFKIEKSAAFTTPGHPEIELALFKLYEATGEKRYLDLSKFFIDSRANNQKDFDYFKANDYKEYNLITTFDDMPIREHNTIDGHCVRTLYLLSGAADVAAEAKDEELMAACKRIYDNGVEKRMYITGGMGSTYMGEAFTSDYDLPNRTAYTETCASIALIMFANRMMKIEENAKYADVIERVIYNGFLSGVSMDGKSFFYENPLEIDCDFNNAVRTAEKKVRYPITQRLEVFNCSCCPPNILRFIASVSGLILSKNDDTLFVNQYMSCKGSFGNCDIEIVTDYPTNGNIKISYKGNKKYLALRIPAWCKDFSINCEYEIKNGYVFIKAEDATDVELSFDMPVTIIKSNRRVHENAGRIAVMRGPVVYCIEGVDNGKDLKTVSVDTNAEFSLCDGEFILPNIKTVGSRPTESDELYSFYNDAEEEFELTLIPYYAFANRSESEMIVWLLKK